MQKREFWKDPFCDRNSLLYHYVGGGAFDAPPFAKFSFLQGKYYYPPFIFLFLKVFEGCGGLFTKSPPRIPRVSPTVSTPLTDPDKMTDLKKTFFIFIGISKTNDKIKAFRKKAKKGGEFFTGRKGKNGKNT